MKTLKQRKKSVTTFLVAILIVTAAFTLYFIKRNIQINKSFIVTQNDLYFSKLPSSFENYKILQITDLHSMEFGDFNEDLIYAIIKSESNFDEEAISHKEAKGLMQIMYTTAQDVAKILEIDLTEETILEPEINIQIGTKYISMLIQKYEVTELALAAYNAGSGNVDKWIDSGTLKSDGSDIENIPYKETNMYVRKIINNYKMYQKIYNYNEREHIR